MAMIGYIACVQASLRSGQLAFGPACIAATELVISELGK